MEYEVYTQSFLLLPFLSPPPLSVLSRPIKSARGEGEGERGGSEGRREREKDKGK